MRALVPSKAIPLVTCFALAASEHIARADGLRDDGHELQSFENAMTVDEYNGWCRKNHREMRKYFRSAAENAFSSVGIPERAVGYMDTAVALATRDSKLHLNESKTLLRRLTNLTQDRRGIFFGYRKHW